MLIILVVMMITVVMMMMMMMTLGRSLSLDDVPKKVCLELFPAARGLVAIECYLISVLVDGDVK